MLGSGLAVAFPFVALAAARDRRRWAGIAAVALQVALNLWWALPLLNQPNVESAVPWALTRPLSLTVMIVGQIAFVLLLLAAFGLFSPRPGSPKDLAMRAEARGDFLAAGEFWMESGRHRRALRLFLRARAWPRAAEAARSKGDLKQAMSLFAKAGGEHLAAAAAVASRLGDETSAQQLWSRLGSHLVEVHRPEQAIEPFLRSGDLRRAGNAVELAYKSGRLGGSSVDVAIRVAADSGRTSLAAQVAQTHGRLREAAETLTRAGMLLDAARAWEESGDKLKAADTLVAAGRAEQAARLKGEHLLEIGELSGAAAAFESAGMLRQAGAALERLGHWAEAFDRYQRAGLQREAAEVARDHLDPADAARIFASIEEWEDAALAWEATGNPQAAAEAYERAGDTHRAEQILEAAGLKVELAQLLARMGRPEEGFKVLFQAGDMRAAWELLSSCEGTFPALASELAQLADWLLTAADVTTAIGAVQRATAGQETSRELLPALYALALLLEQHGDLRAAEGAWQRILDFDYSYRDVAARLQAASLRRAAPEQRLPSGPLPGQEVPADAAATDPGARYQLGPELGRGGMGVVYKAQDKRLGRTIALKVLSSSQLNPEAIRRFEREARAAAALSHPGIVHIYDFDRGFGSFFISMEFISGSTLNQLLKAEPLFIRRHLLTLLHQIADAVAYAHERHVVHRDLKPANMILADRRQVKILDFGIARRLDDIDLASSGATGTPLYMAPEQILNEEPDERTDVYALGVTFFQLVTGALPFASGNVLRAHLEQPPPDPLTMAPDADPGVCHLILRCLAKSRDDRPRDGSALLAAIAGLADRATP
jgi:eukaryotic-like serine/threonine-protein kinase